MVNAFKYIVSSDGICKDADYAYLGYVRLHACVHRPENPLSYFYRKRLLVWDINPLLPAFKAVVSTNWATSAAQLVGFNACKLNKANHLACTVACICSPICIIISNIIHIFIRLHKGV